jgi:hypothetical protein
LKAYRIYLVGPDGRVQLGHAFEALHDDAARERALAHAGDGQVAELWEGGRMIGRFGEDDVFGP